MEVLIVGAGAMGRWLASVLDANVAVADVDDDAARELAAAADGRVVPVDPDGTTRSGFDDDDERFDVVCLAVPMGVVESAVEAQAGRADGAIVDVSGVMAAPLSAMAGRAPDIERLSLHPLFAPQRAPGSVAYVRGEPGPLTDALLADLERAGNDLVETTAAEHDAAMESVQAATHAATIAFGLAARPVPEAFETPVYAALREQVERLTDGTPRVYADVQERFDGAESVARAAERVAAADHDELQALLGEVAATWDGRGEGDCAEEEPDRGVHGGPDRVDEDRADAETSGRGRDGRGEPSR
ncbi:prephenate dehydrogenase/arogenate dehydrogenase family protein [Halovivax limisalsi]|uniref:prephenate dehydrogenase/arogenate dehydrogenase family protein n=1 Tax=Halovivax limisalsi TaxID=1453760 RepID=UPI001FFCE15C|nr:prephenate dehydrogenase/arogenate dehydrogenase family protein [Halovivax limisalsi]